ncbi:hypothetical protein DPX16_8370 [Anabarilius grahami]|uniref:Uncharacterized protein n=1 Tax=Anabarilius grahami TaxID=495550 RepID=A0A3N0ZB27_ANAGA|nr:hypothetical protein DPX16_8370 [Anabarilius grahami]
MQVVANRNASLSVCVFTEPILRADHFRIQPKTEAPLPGQWLTKEDLSVEDVDLEEVSLQAFASISSVLTLSSKGSHGSIGGYPSISQAEGMK